MIIENDGANRLLAERILDLAGYRHCAAANGQEALDLLRARPVDFILTDLSMPVLDGFALVQAVRRAPDLAAIPIVALTASASWAERQRLLALGCTAVLTKPYRPRELQELIARLLAPPPQEADDARHAALFRGVAGDYRAHS